MIRARFCLKYEVGNYYLFIGFAPWDMFIEISEELAGVKWHPDTAYFIPASDGVPEPFASCGDIRVYIQEGLFMS